MREQNHWTLQLADENGQTVDYKLATFWDSEAPDAAAAVTLAAQAEQSYKAGRKFFAVTKPTLVS